MAQFLSADWFAELEMALRAAGPLASSTRLLLGQIVTGAPSGEVSFTVALGGGEHGEVLPGVAGASVVLVEDYTTAVAIAGGAPASEALAAGRVKVRGDAAALLAAEELLSAVGPSLAGLAAMTSF